MESFPHITIDEADLRPAGSLRSRIGPIAACIASGLVHFGLLIWLATWLIPGKPMPGSGLVWASWENPLEDSAVPVRMVDTPAVSIAEVDLPPIRSEALSTPGSSGWDAAPIGSVDVAKLLADADQGNAAQEGQGQGKADSPGDGDGAAGGGGEPITFFDIPLPLAGEKFVFIVDASGSMHGKRFQRARRELIYTLRRLGSGHRFYVLFFNEYDFPQFHPNRTRDFLPATPENIAKVETWATAFKPAGDTHPMSAFRKALELRPDAIFFLSDGAFEVRTLDLIKQFNKNRTVINTIGLEDKSGEMLLEEIARRNAGKYQFVE